MFEELRTVILETKKLQPIRITVKSLAVGGTVNPSVTTMIYAMDIPLTLLSMDAISVAALVIQVSRHALRAYLQVKVQ